MIFNRLRPLPGSETLEGVTEDFRESRRLEKYRLGKRALYFPAGFSWEYLPLREITGICPVTRVIQSENGVCPFAMEVPGVKIRFREKDMVLETEKEKSSRILLSLGLPFREEEQVL